MTPHIIISEGVRVEKVHAPIQILYSGITKVDTDTSLLIELDTNDTTELVSRCPDKRILLIQEPNRSIISWKTEGDCVLPLVTYRGKNYILPNSEKVLQPSMLSDISSETLRNTVTIAAPLRSDIRLSALRTRKTLTNIDTILSARSEKFLLPIEGAPLPDKSTHLPNSPRPFRADSTDGIHHGWDFYVKEGTPVRAIEDGYIVHIKRDFTWKEMDHLHATENALTQQKNLDVYRGNTVYLKTLSGHVGIYAHLGEIPDDLQIGDYISRGDFLGEVGDSAVPDKKYLYHLHFELAMNPFQETKAGYHTFEDILLWPWYGKGRGVEWVRKNDDTLFVSE